MTDHPDIVPVGGYPYETWRYVGPLDEAEFEASSAFEGGRPVLRNGEPVTSVSLASLRWAGARAGEEMIPADRAALTDALRRIYTERGGPFDLVLETGEVEDETGTVRPGFRTALPRAEHSDGWTVVDLFLSPEFPDAADYPPIVEYFDASGVVEIPREIVVAAGVRRIVLNVGGMRLVGDRAGEPLTGVDREQVVARLRMVYDRWGIAYELRG